MTHPTSRAGGVLLAVVLAVAVLELAIRLHAQGRGGPAPAPARVGAPIDLTGYWVSVVTQDWRWRMVTPAKGDYLNVPMTIEAKRVADSWDPAKDEAAGEQCKSYGAPGLMSIPGRLHITWQDDDTLKVETDAGMQTRLFHFTKQTVPATSSTWQGYSVAQWERPRESVSLLLQPSLVGRRDGSAPKGGSLKVVTTRLRPGYLRKNGVPYSGNAVLTEYWDLFKERNGDQWMVITTLTEDPTYLREPRLTGLHFKKEPNGAKWDPTPCSARW